MILFSCLLNLLCIVKFITTNLHGLSERQKLKLFVFSQTTPGIIIVNLKKATLEEVRDIIRQKLHTMNSA